VGSAVASGAGLGVAPAGRGHGQVSPRLRPVRLWWVGSFRTQHPDRRRLLPGPRRRVVLQSSGGARRIWWGIEAGGRFEKLFLVVVVVVED
jgi:hypothetical protein